MKVLAIDPGTAIVGYGIVEYNKKFKLIDYGCIYTDKDDEMPKRLKTIYNGIDNLIKLYKPDSVAIEELFFFKNSKTVISVGQARGVLLLCCEMNGVKSYGYTPLQVKQGIASYGRATKNQVQEMVRRILNLEEIPKPDDAADALALAVTHINYSGNILSGIKETKPVETKKINTANKSKLSIEEYRNAIKR